MTVVSNASPLICLARVEQLPLLPGLFRTVHIAAEVHHEVVERGAGRPAAETVRKAAWIKVHPPRPESERAELRRRHPLGDGELGTLHLAKRLSADLVLLDERAARKLARQEGFVVMGSVGLLEAGYRRGLITDLREVYQRLLARGIFIEKRILNQSLTALNLEGL